MGNPSGSREADDDGVRIVRRRFVGAGVAVAGSALLPAAAASASRPPASPAAPSAGNAAAAVPSTTGAIPQMPLRTMYPHLPAVPVDVAGAIDTLARLKIRAEQTLQAVQGLNQRFRINGKTRTAYAFLYGGMSAPSQIEALDELTKSLRERPGEASAEVQRRARRRDAAAPTIGTSTPLSLDSPEQFSIGWTTFPNVYETGLKSLPEWASSLTDADSATQQFWPMIAEHGDGFNLIISQRVTNATAGSLRRQFGTAWTSQVRAALAAGNLYVIDLSLFESLRAQTVNGAPRFTPATVTLLTRNPRTKSLTPVAIIVSGHQGSGRTLYRRATATDGAWLYALQAAKTSVSVYGIWIGHVYHWHLVTAAMQMTMLNTLPTSHPVYKLLAPQSRFAIQFDDVLLAAWSAIAPPTSLTSGGDLLALANDFANGRSYFDDDPTTTVQQLGLRRADFTAKTAWDKYPVVGRLLSMWDLVSTYVNTFVETTYASDGAVAADSNLQTWIATAGSSNPTTGGNVQGLPTVSSRSALEHVLTSLIYRITVHGISRQTSTSSPTHTFVPNFPMCLQSTTIPGPRARLSTSDLLGYLPNTDTISSALTFYFTFAFSTPYVPFIPLAGVGTNLFFPGGIGDKRNQALRELRRGLAAFIDDYQPGMPQRFQWPLNIET